eukprot:4169248-Prymnesium_polylepis.1
MASPAGSLVGTRWLHQRCLHCSATSPPAAPRAQARPMGGRQSSTPNPSRSTPAERSPCCVGPKSIVPLVSRDAASRGSSLARKVMASGPRGVLPGTPPER